MLNFRKIVMNDSYGSSSASSLTHGETQKFMVQRLIECWQDARVGVSLPYRRDINPTLLGAAIPYAFVVQYRKITQPKFRLVGNKINDLFGADARGMPFSAIL